uniref:Speriolin C-terminal domain-containing protein n=1 Tax=Ciona savignyi TaxID=51511 RepID=H2YXS9_CIOSA
MDSSEFIALTPEYEELTRENEELQKAIRNLSIGSISEHKLSNSSSRGTWFQTQSLENSKTELDLSELPDQSFVPLRADDASPHPKYFDNISYAMSLPVKDTSRKSRSSPRHGHTPTDPINSKDDSNANNDAEIVNIINRIQPAVKSSPPRRIIGEIAFQLDRRILHSIFTHRRRLYGFTDRNISEKIEEYTSDFVSGVVDMEKRNSLIAKRDDTFKMLQKAAGYNLKFHPMFSEVLVNKFGVLRVNLERKDSMQSLMDPEFLKTTILTTLESNYIYDTMILLESLLAIFGKRWKANFSMV